MKNLKYFFIGIFYLIPTLIMIYLIYAVFFEWHEQYELGIIALFGVCLLGAMTYKAFSLIGTETETIKTDDIPVNSMLVQKRPETIKNDDVPVNSMLVQKRPEQVKEEIKYFCPYCGRTIEKEWKYCYTCGKEINVKS